MEFSVNYIINFKLTVCVCVCVCGLKILGIIYVLNVDNMYLL